MESKGWYARLNLMPPKPDDFHVAGELFVSNPGVQTELVERTPQGINPAVLLLDLHLVQRPGVWPQVMTLVQARYDLVLGPNSVHYTHVEIYSNSELIVKMDVDVVQ